MKKKGEEKRSVKSIGCELLCEVAQKSPDGTTYGHSFKYILSELKRRKPDSNTRIRSLYNFVTCIRAGKKDFKEYELPDRRLDSGSNMPTDSIARRTSTLDTKENAPVRKLATRTTTVPNNTKRNATPKKTVSTKATKRATVAKKTETMKSTKRLRSSNLAKSNAISQPAKASGVAKQRVTSELIGAPENMNWKSGTKIAFIRANWHTKIVDACRKAFVSNLKMSGIKESQIEVFDVPGSFEIPLLAKQLAKKGEYDLIVGSGLVIDGGIYRHEFVAEAVINGLMQVQLDSEVPILSAVLTPHHFHESDVHKKFFKKHFKKKGQEIADAAKLVLNNKQRLLNNE